MCGDEGAEGENQKISSRLPTAPESDESDARLGPNTLSSGPGLKLRVGQSHAEVPDFFERYLRMPELLPGVSGQVRSNTRKGGPSTISILGRCSQGCCREDGKNQKCCEDRLRTMHLLKVYHAPLLANLISSTPQPPAR